MISLKVTFKHVIRIFQLFSEISWSMKWHSACYLFVIFQFHTDYWLRKNWLKLGTDVFCEKYLIRKFKHISWTLKPWNWAYSAHGFSWYANLLKSVSNNRFIIEAQCLTNMIVSFRLIWKIVILGQMKGNIWGFFRAKKHFNQIWEDFCHKLGFNIIWNRL